MKQEGRWPRLKAQAQTSAVLGLESPEFPPASEKMGVEEMLLEYTINGAEQLGVEGAKGSIEAGKDADFLVFDNDLLAAEPEGFSHNMPTEVYIGGKKVK